MIRPSLPAAWLCVACALAGCRPAPAGPVAQKKRVVLGITSEPDSLCPLVAEGAVGQELSAFLARDLVLNDPQWRTVPDLARGLPTTRTTPEGSFIASWRLRDDARWEDGTAVSAADVRLAWRVQTDPARQTVSGRDVAEKIDAISASADGHSMDVTWKQPVSFFADVRTHRPLPAHVLESQLVDDKGNLRALKDLPFCRKPLSNGPFALQQWVPGQHLIFQRNPFTAPRPLLDEVVVKIVPSSTALQTALLAGEIDATFPNAGLSPVEAQAFVAAHGDTFSMVSTPGQVWTHIDFNLDDSLLKDPRVREAIAVAIPRQQIFDAVSHGLYQLSDTYLPPLHWGHADVPPIVYDVARANQLLDQAGFAKKGDDGVRMDARGARLSLTLAAASGLKESEELLLLVKEALAKVGVHITLELTPFKVFNGALAKERSRRQLSFYAWVFDGSTFGGSMWRADRIPVEDNQYKGQNFPGYKNDDVTRWLLESDASVEPRERVNKLAQVQQQLRRDLPALPMYFRPAVVVVRNTVSGLQPTGTLTPLAWNAHAWNVRAP